MYKPHVFGVRVGQNVEFVNSDATAHNVHALPNVNQEFNFSQLIQTQKDTRFFTAPEVMVRFKCDMHNWMSAYVGVLEHPYFAVTEPGGTFELKNVPPGTYTIEAWHEKLGTQTQRVTLGREGIGGRNVHIQGAGGDDAVDRRRLLRHKVEGFHENDRSDDGRRARARAPISSRSRSRASTCWSWLRRSPGTRWRAATPPTWPHSAGPLSAPDWSPAGPPRSTRSSSGRPTRRCAARGCGRCRTAASPRPRRWFSRRCSPSSGLRSWPSGVNLLSAVVALATLASYAVVYTPLKRLTSFSTVIGAIPGALPPVIGWTAATGSLSQGAWVLFGIVFLWQLPHFLAIAWMYREDYARAGFPMLPVIEPDGRSTARQAVVYTVALLPLALAPTLVGMSGIVYFAGALTLTLLFLGDGDPVRR